MYLVLYTRDNPEYLEQIRYILDNNPDELKITKYGWNALNIASSNADTSSTPETLILLLKYHDSSYDYNYYRTAIYNALQDSSFNTVKILLDNSNITDLTNHTGKNILIDLIICDYKKPEYMKDLFEYILYNTKINIDLEDNFGVTAFDYAMIYHKLDIAELIQTYQDTSLDIKRSGSRLKKLIKK